MAQAGFYADLYNSQFTEEVAWSGTWSGDAPSFFMLKKDKHTGESRKFNQNHQKNVPNIRKLDII